MSREAPTNGSKTNGAKTNGAKTNGTKTNGAKTSGTNGIKAEPPRPGVPRRPSYTLLGSPDPAPIVLTAAAVLAFCAGCTNACAMLGVFRAPGIRASGVTHVTGSLTKVGMVLANGPAATGPSLAVLGYVVGAALTGATVPAGMFQREHARAYGRIVMATAVLLALAAALQEADHGHGFGFLPLMGVACASGAQNGLMTAVSSSMVRTTHMTGSATDVGLILGRALGRLLRREGCGFTLPEKNRLGLYARLTLGFVGGAAVGTALVEEAEVPNVRALFAPAAILLVAGGVAAVGFFDPRADLLEAPVAGAVKL